MCATGQGKLMKTDRQTDRQTADRQTGDERDRNQGKTGRTPANKKADGSKERESRTKVKEGGQAHIKERETKGIS